MTCKSTSPVEVHRIVSRFIAILAAIGVLLALFTPEALAQVRQAGQRRVVSAHSTRQNAEFNILSSSLFLPVATYDAGGHATIFVAVADVNGDGKLDVVVANYCYSIPGAGTCESYEGTVGVLLGNGDGTFQPAVTYASGAELAVGIAIADVNGDGNPDLIVAHNCGLPYCSGDLGLLLGNGDGTFQPAASLASGTLGARAVASADVNADGKADLVVVGAASVNNDGAVGVLLGNGDGTFQKPVIYNSVGQSAEFVVIADVNGDGRLDLLVANGCLSSRLCGSEGGVAVLLGNGDGTFRPAKQYFSGGNYPLALAVADLNGDGKLDVVAANSHAPTPDDVLGVLLGNGDGTFRPAVKYDSGGLQTYWHLGMEISDVNGDGKPDLVIGSECPSADCRSEGVVGVLLGNGDGTFQTVMNFDSGGYLSGGVAVGDVNGDGWPDVLVASPCNTTCEFFTWAEGVVGVLLNAGPQHPTTTALASSLNPSVFGQMITFAAQVTSDAGTPTGTVQILNGSTVVGAGTLVNGSVSIPVSTLPVGSDSITASYLGGSGFAPSKSSALAQTVRVATTATALTSSLNPAAANQSVTFTATVASHFGGAATGSVVFSSGSQMLGTASLSGNTASLITSFSAAATYSISAKYNGDGNNSGSTSSTLSEAILAATTTTLVSSLNPSFVGQAVTFTATLSSAAGVPPNGETITFKNGSAVLGTGTLSGGMASFATSSLAAGFFTITACYPGDTNFAASTSPGLRQVVNSTTKSATATTLVSSLNPSIYGQKVTWTARVTTSGSVPPTGKVNFTWSIYTIGAATLNSSGVATLTKPNLNADTYPLQAVYVGDTSNLGSTSSVISQVVTQAVSSATLTSSPNPSTSGQAVTFTATITSPTVISTGPVTFAVGTTVLGTAQLSGGKAKFTTSTLAVGSTKVTATYYGDSNITKSSASVTQTVQ